MSQSNRDIINGIYSAFERGKVPAVLGAMTPKSLAARCESSARPARFSGCNNC